MKLQKFKLLKDIKITNKFQGILLSPTGKKMISLEDKNIIAEKGVCVIDCSWAKFNQLHLNMNKLESRLCKYLVRFSTLYGCC